MSLQQSLSAKDKAELSGKFPFFWWESNQCWGFVTEVQHLQWIHEHYKKSAAGRINVLDAQASTLGNTLSPPNFGLRMEHNGSVTLGEYLKEHKVDISKLNLDPELCQR